jgi:hypothetical protein
MLPGLDAGPLQVDQDMRANLFLSATMSALVAMLPVHAAAQELPRDAGDQVSVQERPRPSYDPLGVRLGGFDLNASVALGVTSTDNVFATEADTESDVATFIRPQATLGSHWSRHALRFRAGAYADNHADFSQDDIVDYYTGVDGRLDIGSRSEVGGGASLNQDHQRREDPDSPAGAAEPIEYKRDTVYLYARHAFSRVRLTGRVQRDAFDYKDTPANGGGTLDQDYRDYDQTLESIRAEYAFSARISAVAEAAVNQREYDNSSLRDSDGSYLGVGVSFDFTNLLRGQALVTQYSQDYDDPAIGTVDGTGFSGNLQWFPTQLTTVSLEAGRTVEDSAFLGDSYIRTRIGGRVDHELRRNILLNAGARLENREYQGVSERDDDLLAVDVGATYIANRRMRFNVGYGYRQNDSNFIGEDFEENRFTAGVSFHL